MEMRSRVGVDIRKEPLDRLREDTGVLGALGQELGVQTGVDEDTLVGGVVASVALGVPGTSVLQSLNQSKADCECQ